MTASIPAHRVLPGDRWVDGDTQRRVGYVLTHTDGRLTIFYGRADLWSATVAPDDLVPVIPDEADRPIVGLPL